MYDVTLNAAGDFDNARSMRENQEKQDVAQAKRRLDVTIQYNTIQYNTIQKTTNSGHVIRHTCTHTCTRV